MLQAAQARADAAGELDWLVSIDSTVVRAHQSAAGARKGGHRALGRSRGGLTSKVHLAVDGGGVADGDAQRQDRGVVEEVRRAT